MTVGPVFGWAYFIPGTIAIRDEWPMSMLRAAIWSTSRLPWARKVPVNAGLDWAFIVVQFCLREDWHIFKFLSEVCFG